MTNMQEQQDSAVAAPERKSLWQEVVEWVLYILAAFVIASLIQSEVFALTQVNMSSMKNTLIEGDQLIMNKLAYRFRSPEKGDILIFLKDETSETFLKRMRIYFTDVSKKLNKEFRRNRLIKRVIGIPGDTIEIRDQVLYINGLAQDEDYARIDPNLGIVKNGYLEKTVVPDDMLFVMGDNRGESLDSRSFGFIDQSWVEGKAVFRLSPFSKFGPLH